MISVVIGSSVRTAISGLLSDLDNERAERVDGERRSRRDDGCRGRLDDQRRPLDHRARREVVAPRDARLPLATAEDDRRLVVRVVTRPLLEALRSGAAEVAEAGRADGDELDRSAGIGMAEPLLVRLVEASAERGVEALVPWLRRALQRNRQRVLLPHVPEVDGVLDPPVSLLDPLTGQRLERLALGLFQDARQVPVADVVERRVVRPREVL